MIIYVTNPTHQSDNSPKSSRGEMRCWDFLGKVLQGAVELFSCFKSGFVTRNVGIYITPITMLAYPFALWIFNIAMESSVFIDDTHDNLPSHNMMISSLQTVKWRRYPPIK